MEIRRKSQNRISHLGFELIKPNLANISESLEDELKGLIEDANSHKSRVELNAAKGAFLENIDETNDRIGTLVEFSSRGGGNIFIRLTGLKRKIQINKQIIKETSIGKIELEGASEDVIKTLERMIKF